MSFKDATGSGTSMRFKREARMLECTICNEPISADDIYYTPCSHTFNLKCILEWLKISRSCPECRQVMLPHHLRRLYVNTSSPTRYEDKVLSCRKHINDLNGTITQQQNLIQKYEAQLAEKEKEVLKMTEEMENMIKSEQGSRCSPPVTRSRAKSAKNVASDIEDPTKNIDALIKDIKCETKASIAAERQKRRETSKKLQEERARISELKKELNTRKAEYKVCQKRMKQLEKMVPSALPSEDDNRRAAKTEKKTGQKKTDPPDTGASTSSRTRGMAPR